MSEAAGLYGEVAGSSPNWATANLHDRGRAHIHQPSALDAGGLQAFYTQSPPAHRSLRRMYEPPVPRSYAEPVMHEQGRNQFPTSYFERRANSADNPLEFRRSLRPLPDPGTLRPDRPEGKRIIPEPHGPGPHATGTRMAPDEVRYREPARLPEPNLGRLGRPVGISNLRQSDSELTHEQAVGRKVRVDEYSYRGTGRAGDLSTTLAKPLTADYADPTFFKTLKDTPTFIRFCTTLPAKPAVSPHERRAAQMRRMHEAERERDRQLVTGLKLADPEEDGA